MIRVSVLCLLLSGVSALSLAAQEQTGLRVLPSDRQIAAAVLPLPAVHRPAATVLGYDAQGRLVRLRGGSGIFTCLADDPRDDRFHVACYHNSLEPFMARGRQLRAQGVQGDAVDSTRNADVAAGRLRMPAMAALYSLTGPGTSYDRATSAVTGAQPLFVVYVPGATEASTGISTTPRSGAPWLMEPGTPKAHIMFQPGMGR